jgi:hypothetical protein
MQHKLAHILKAIADGKTVQFRFAPNKQKWLNYNPDSMNNLNPLTSNDYWEWRIAPLGREFLDSLPDEWRLTTPELAEILNIAGRFRKKVQEQTLNYHKRIHGHYKGIKSSGSKFWIASDVKKFIKDRETPA